MKKILFLIAVLCFLITACGSAVTSLPATPVPSPVPSSTASPSATPTEAPTAVTVDEKYKALQTLLDAQKVPYTIADGKIVIDDYTTQTSDNLALESGKLTQTTDLNHPDILSAQDEKGNLYLFNPNHGWFKPVDKIKNEDGTEADGTDLSKYTEIDLDYVTDGRLDLTRAYDYAKSPEKINIDTDPVYWVTGWGSEIRLSFYPISRSVDALIDWPNEYEQADLLTKENKGFLLSGFYKVNFKDGRYIYVINRTLATDKTQTTGASNGFDPWTFEKAETSGVSDGSSDLKDTLNAINSGALDIVSVLTPPEKLPDGTPIINYPVAEKNNPIVAGLQGPSGELISLFSQADQERIILVLTKSQNDNFDYSRTAPLTDNLALSKLSNKILLSEIDN